VIGEGRLELKVAEIFDPGKLHELLGTSPRGTTPTAPRLDRVPATTLLVGTFHVDFAWLYRTVRELIPEPEKPRLTNGEAILKGLLLGQDIQTQILPAIGPRVLAMVDAPDDVETQPKADGSPSARWLFPTVIALELEHKPVSNSSAVGSAPRQVAVAEALDNALNTLLACLTFDHRFGQTRARIVSREVSGVTVKSLEPHIPLAYAIDRPGHRLVLGSSPAAVERYLKAGSDPAAGSRFRQLQTQGFATADSFLCVDLVAVQELLIKQRDILTDTIANRKKRPRTDVAYDLEQVLALSRLFDAAYLTSRVDTDSATVFHTLGFLPRSVDRLSPSGQPERTPR
jgi:hypothetical protein